jgi:RimJ/RimL family protein N-acetyltransferase
MINQGTIQGERVVLQPATPDDERHILNWLLRSDVTPSMLGPPLFPERPVPVREDSSERLDSHYLDGTAPELGRCFLILVHGEPVGQVTYNDIMERDGLKQVELDIWMRSESCCGKGYGTDAIDALCRYLHERFGVQQFMVQPSARNPRAIHAYEKLGFKSLDLPLESARELWGPNDYWDSVYMVRTIV